METYEIDTKVLKYYLKHVRGFLHSQKKVKAFPGVEKDIEKLLVQISRHDNFISCQGFDDDCKTILADIKTELIKNKNEYELCCTYFHDLTSGSRSLLYSKNKINMFKQMQPLRKPNSITSTNTRSCDSQSSLISTSFKLNCLNATLKFIKDDTTLTLRYPDMATEQADFIVNMFEQSDSESGIGLGYKTMYAPLWEAMKIFGCKYKFTLRYSEPRNPDMKCLVLDKIPIITKISKENQNQQTNTPASSSVILPTESNREITSKTDENMIKITQSDIKNMKLTHKEVKTLTEMNALPCNKRYIKLLQVLTNLGPEYLTELFQKIHTFITDQKSTTITFERLTKQEAQVIRSYRNLCCKTEYLPFFNDEGKMLARLITERLEEKVFSITLGVNKFVVTETGQLRKCKRLKDALLQTVTFHKIPVPLRQREKALRKLKLKEYAQLRRSSSSSSINSLNSLTSTNSRCSSKQNFMQSIIPVKEMGSSTIKSVATPSYTNIKPAITSFDPITSVTRNNNINTKLATNSYNTNGNNIIIIPATTSSNSTKDVARSNNINTIPATTSSNTSTNVASSNNTNTRPATTSSNKSTNVASSNNTNTRPATTSSNKSTNVASSNNTNTRPATTSSNKSTNVASGNNINTRSATTSSNTSTNVASGNNTNTRPATTSSNTSTDIASSNNINTRPATTSSNTSTNVASSNNINTRPATTMANPSTSVASGNNTIIKPEGHVNKIKMKLIEGLNQPVNSDKALKMMVNMGWSGGALGVKADGITEPIAPGIEYYLETKKRLGLGGLEVLKKQRETRKKILSKKEYHTNSLLIMYSLLTTSQISQQIELPQCVFQREWSFVKHWINSFNSLNCRQSLGDEKQMELVHLINSIMACGCWQLKGEAFFNRCVIIITKIQIGEYLPDNKTTTEGDTISIYSNNGRSMKRLKKPKAVILPTEDNYLQNFNNESTRNNLREVPLENCFVSNQNTSLNKSDNNLQEASVQNCFVSKQNNSVNDLSNTAPFDFKSNFLNLILSFCKQDVSRKTVNCSYNLNENEKAYILEIISVLNKEKELKGWSVDKSFCEEIHNAMIGYCIKCHFSSTYSFDLEKQYNKMADNRTRDERENNNQNFKNSSKYKTTDNNIVSENKGINTSQDIKGNVQEDEYIGMDGAKYTSTEEFETSLLIRSVKNINDDINMLLNNDQITNNSSSVINNSDKGTNKSSKVVYNSNTVAKNYQDISDSDNELNDICVVIATDDEDDLLKSDDEFTKNDLAKELKERKDLFKINESIKIESDVPNYNLNIKNEDENIEEDIEIDVAIKQESSPGKRSRCNSECASQESKKTRHYSKKIAIVPQNYPQTHITDKIAREIQITIRNSIDNNNSSELPLLKCDGLQNGMLLYCCFTEKSFHFIEDLVTNINLKIIYDITKEECSNTTNKDIRIKMKVQINSFFVESSQLTLQRLVKYNKGLNTTNWKVIKRLFSKIGDAFLVEIDKSSYDYIREANFSLFAGIDQAIFSQYWD